MSFTWIGKQGARSTDGFEVQSVSRFAIAYRERGQVMTISVEPGLFGGGHSVSIAANAFEYWDNYRVANSKEKQAQLLANFRAAMEFQGIAIDV